MRFQVHIVINLHEWVLANHNPEFWFQILHWCYTWTALLTANQNRVTSRTEKAMINLANASWRNIYLGKNGRETGEFRYSLTITNSPLVT